MASNKLLSLLSPETSDRIQQFLEPVDLQQGEVLYEPGKSLPYVYFHMDGLSSEVITDHEDQKIEVGCIGLEGLSGIPVVLGVPSSPHRAIVEVAGRALRIRSADLQHLMDDSAEIRRLLLRYVHAFMVQVASTALVDGRYSVLPRLARWLLMAHDRIEGDGLPLTHDFFALMLGVRRSGVTTATHQLEGEGLIRATRGLITITDRSGLEARAGSSYGFAEAEYRRVLLHDVRLGEIQKYQTEPLSKGNLDAMQR